MGIQISAVIITYNEERNIKRCLASLQKVADEIIVVDSFSTDKTKEICQNYRVTFIENAFQGHIQQKNFAKNKAQHHYILSLDADEALTPALEEEILNIKKDCQYDGYSFNRLNYYCGKWIKHTSWYPDKKLRLAKNTLCHWGGQNPHDELLMEEGSSQLHIKEDLLHYTYYTIEEHIAQANKFSTIGAQELAKKGQSSSIIKALIKMKAKFIKEYLIRKGFLSGKEGFLIAVISAFEVFLKYVKLMKIKKDLTDGNPSTETRES